MSHDRRTQIFFRFGEEGLQGGGGGGGGFGGADPNDIFRMFFGGGEGFIKLSMVTEHIIILPLNYTSILPFSQGDQYKITQRKTKNKNFYAMTHFLVPLRLTCRIKTRN